ncbi:UNVERIFIED_CONTAM: hypothetical protein GTU68_018189, partial [Idotea baltica]|nr:hypothetical protein [Idotea baltica]
MYGNILCLSPDDFTTMTIATVRSRDDLHENVLGVKVETEPFFLDSNVSYTIIESKAYFVSYMHTLKALQQFDSVPLEDYIVYTNECNKAPVYLDKWTNYELKENFSVEVLGGIDTWPTCKDLQLDESQLRALHGALTRQMAIIQGPPGTGKTFLGLEIAKILLNNNKVWNVNNSPILVVCFTNHALDQFLEGIANFTTRILRIGS